MKERKVTKKQNCCKKKHKNRQSFFGTIFEKKKKWKPKFCLVLRKCYKPKRFRGIVCFRSFNWHISELWKMGRMEMQKRSFVDLLAILEDFEKIWVIINMSFQDINNIFGENRKIDIFKTTLWLQAYHFSFNCISSYLIRNAEYKFFNLKWCNIIFNHWHELEMRPLLNVKMNWWNYIHNNDKINKMCSSKCRLDIYF